MVLLIIIRLKGLIADKKQDNSLDTSLSSPVSGITRNAKGLDSTDAASPSSLELQSLRKKLDTSEKLNAALKYELEVNKRNAKSEASSEPFMGHVEELRQLRSRLEESIKTYEALCVQLEEKLSELNERDDEDDGLQNRISLAKENDDLRVQLTQFTEKLKTIQTQLENQRIAAKK